MADHVELGIGQQAVQFSHDRHRDERAAVGMQQKGRAPYILQPARKISANQHAKCIEDRLAWPLFLLLGEPGTLPGRQRIVVETIGQEGIGPRFHPARVELALPLPAVAADARLAETGWQTVHVGKGENLGSIFAGLQIPPSTLTVSVTTRSGRASAAASATVPPIDSPTR